MTRGSEIDALLDLCLALSVPSPRHLERMLTRQEIDLWLEKLKLDQFSTHGMDVRRSMQEARLMSVLYGMVGKTKTFDANDFMPVFGQAEQREDSLAVMTAKCIAIAKVFGGTVIDVDGKEL